MLRQASSRNHRSKGFKVKHGLQICLLIAICIWLLYQVKHSHEKKRAFEERNSKILNKVTESEADLFKFGRRDLPRTEDKGSANESHGKKDENEETLEEEEEELDMKQEEIEDEDWRGAGDDDIDEQDQDDGDEEAEHWEEESTDEEDKDSHNGGVDMVEDRQNEGGTQEAREENYKRDDASSAVAHETQETESKADEEQVNDKVVDESGVNGSKRDWDSSVDGDDGDADGSKGQGAAENVVKKVVEQENIVKGSDDGSRGDNDLSAGSRGASVSNVSDTVVSGTIQTGNLSSGVTAADNKGVEVEFSKPDNGTVSNSAEAGANSLMEQQTNLTMAAESHTQVELQANSTGASDHQIEMQNNSTVFDSDGISTLNDTTTVVSAQNQSITTDNATPAEDDDAHSSQNVEGNGDVAGVGFDNSERGRMDLSTLPNIQSEVNSTDDKAAE